MVIPKVQSVEVIATQYAKRFTCIPLDDGEKKENDAIIEAISGHFLAGVRYAVDMLKLRSWEIPMWIESGPRDGEIDPEMFVDWITQNLQK